LPHLFPYTTLCRSGCQCASMSRGLMTDSTARPHRVNDRATTAIARPGGIMYHQMPAPIAPAVRADSRMPPQETVVGSPMPRKARVRSEEHTSELQSRFDLVCRLLLEKK